MVNVFTRGKYRERKAASGPVFILGLGKFGQALGEELTASGVEVLGADRDPKIVQELSATFDHVVTADTTSPEVLQQIGVAEATRVVIGIGRHIEQSLLTASAVVDMGVPSIWAKADNQAHAKILGQIGVHHIIRPEADTGRRVAHMIGSELQDYLEFERGFGVAKIAPPVRALDRTIEDVLKPQSMSVQILAVRPRDGHFRRAEMNDVLRAGDLIIVAGSIQNIERFAAGK